MKWLVTASPEQRELIKSLLLEKSDVELEVTREGTTISFVDGKVFVQKMKSHEQAVIWTEANSVKIKKTIRQSGV